MLPEDMLLAGQEGSLGLVCSTRLYILIFLCHFVLFFDNMTEAFS